MFFDEFLWVDDLVIIKILAMECLCLEKDGRADSAPFFKTIK